jgi:hypothetical protein
MRPSTEETDAAGRVRFQLEADTQLRISASHSGFATSTVDRVQVKQGCLTAVMLPMQVVPPKQIISDMSK